MLLAVRPTLLLPALMLASCGLSPEEELVEAIQEGDVKRVQAAIDAGVDVDCQIARENPALHDTPLYLACKAGRVDLVSALVEAGADLMADDGMGNTPLGGMLRRWSLQPGHHECLVYLLEHGFNVDYRDRGGVGLLHLAAQSSPPSFTATLLEFGADPDARTNAGATPLHNAAQRIDSRAREAVEIVMLLLKAGADPTLRNAAGRAALDLAWTEEAAQVLKDDAAADQETP